MGSRVLSVVSCAALSFASLTVPPPPAGAAAPQQGPVLRLADVLVWTFNERVFTPEDVDQAVYVNPQYCKRAWFKYSGIPYDYFANPKLNLDRIPVALNESGALFEGGVQVSDLHQSAGWPSDSAYDDDHFAPFEVPEPVFEDFTTRDADGKHHPISTIYSFGEELHASIANESYRDFVVFWAEEQIDRGVNALEFDVIGGGYRFSPNGTPGDNPNEGYEDYAVGTANFATTLSVAFARGTAEPVRWFSPKASASSELQPAKRGFDDDKATFWLSDDREPVHTLEVDFGRTRMVQQLVVEFPPSRIQASFRLERWSEGQGWTAFSPAVVMNGNARQSVSFVVDPVATSRVRFSSSEKQAAVAELRIFGMGFRQYLLARYVGERGWALDDRRWRTEKLVDLDDVRQCPDGTMSSFDYRGYLAAHGWTGNPAGGAVTADTALNPVNPLFLEWYPTHYFGGVDGEFRNDPARRQQARDLFVESFSAQRLLGFWRGVADAVHGYAATKNQPLSLTVNGIAPFTDYILTGEATWLLFPVTPAPSASDPQRTELDGSQAQLALWRSVREDKLVLRRLLGTDESAAAETAQDEVPVVTFLDFGYNGMPFRHLGGADALADARVEYLRIYPMEAYAAGVRFCFPVRASEENAWQDVTSSGERVIDTIKRLADFLNAHREVYLDADPSPREGRVTVNGIVPFNGAWNVVSDQNRSPVNGSRVTVALTVARGGFRSYLHVINHDWDKAKHTMRPQRDVPITIPVSGCRRVSVVSPDTSGESELPFTEKDGVVSVRLPSLAYYGVLVLEHGGRPRRTLRRS